MSHQILSTSVRSSSMRSDWELDIGMALEVSGWCKSTYQAVINTKFFVLGQDGVFQSSQHTPESLTTSGTHFTKGKGENQSNGRNSVHSEHTWHDIQFIWWGKERSKGRNVISLKGIKEETPPLNWTYVGGTDLFTFFILVSVIVSPSISHRKYKWILIAIWKR